ncbi:MAG: hypothetical protein Q9184_004932 [Pyrenodesmia sp. 2 TL-2023]
MEVESASRTGDEAVEFTVLVHGQRWIWKVFKPTSNNTGSEAAATEVSVYRHLQSGYLEGLLIPKLVVSDHRLSQSEKSTLRASLEARPPSDWSQEDWDDWGMDHYVSFVEGGQAIQLECIEGTSIAEYRNQGMPPGLDRSLSEGLMTLHGAGILLGSIDEDRIVVLDRFQPENSVYPVIMFTDLSHASIQKPRDVDNVLQRWRELSQLQSVMWDVQVAKESNQGRRLLRSFVENDRAGVKTPDLGPLVEACRKIQNGRLACMPWFEDEENQKRIAGLELTDIVHILRALALNPDGRILGQLLLERIPEKALAAQPLLHYQWLISALSCDRHHLDSAWWRETHELLMAAFDNMIASYNSSDQLLASLEAKRRKALTSRMFGQTEEGLTQLLQGTLAELKKLGLPWYNEQVMRTIELFLNHPSHGQSGAFEATEYIRQMASHTEHTIYYHDLPRPNNASPPASYPTHIGRRVQSMFPLPSNESKAEGASSSSTTPPSCPSQTLSPPQSHNGAVRGGRKRDRDDGLADEHRARTSNIKRPRRHEDLIEAATATTSHPTGIDRYRSFTDHMKNLIRTRSEMAKAEQVRPGRGAKEKLTPPPDGASSNGAGPPNWLAGVETLQEVPKKDCKDLEMTGEAVAYDSCLCLPYRGCNDQVSNLPELERYRDSNFYSAQFAQMQLERRRNTTAAWERKCVGQVQVQDEFLRSIIHASSTVQQFIHGCKGQAPLRGLIFSWMGSNRFSQRLIDRLANHPPSLPSSDEFGAMSEALMERIHGSGVCRLHLNVDNIRLVGAGYYSSPGTAAFDDQTRSTSSSSRNNTPVPQGTASCCKTGHTGAPDQVQTNYPGAGREVALELVSLAESARWCRQGVLEDQHRLQALKAEIRERYK